MKFKIQDPTPETRLKSRLGHVSMIPTCITSASHFSKTFLASVASISIK